MLFIILRISYGFQYTFKRGMMFMNKLVQSFFKQYAVNQTYNAVITCTTKRANLADGLRQLESATKVVINF